MSFPIPDKIVGYEVVVKWNTGERAKFPQPDFDAAMGKATSLGRLPAAREIWINEVTVQPVYHWTRSSDVPAGDRSPDGYEPTAS